MPTVAREDRLDETFAALANPTRRAILARFAQGAATVNELAAPFDLTLPAVSKHIKVLERAGLVLRSRRAQSAVCPRSCTAGGSRDLGRAVPPGLGGPLRPLDGYQQLRPESRGGEGDGVKSHETRRRGRDRAESSRHRSMFVWRMWTEAEHFAAWYGPDGATVPGGQDGRAGRWCSPGRHAGADPHRSDAHVVYR